MMMMLKDKDSIADPILKQYYDAIKRPKSKT